MERLKDKVALITGAASGIGLATAELFAREGARVVLTDRNLDGEKVAAGIDKTGERAIFRPLDVTRESAWIAVIDETVKRFGGLDVLVNNAGVGIVKDVEETTLAEWRFVQSVNVDGVFLGCKHAMKAMRAQGSARGGSIINLSSVAGLIGAPHLAAYCASKGAVRLLTKSVALHGAKHRVRCNSVHPSFIATPMVDAMAQASPDAARMRHAMEQAAPLGGGGLGEPIDVANMILFLASNESKFVTGAELVVDGGTTAR